MCEPASDWAVEVSVPPPKLTVHFKALIQARTDTTKSAPHSAGGPLAAAARCTRVPDTSCGTGQDEHANSEEGNG